MQMFDPAAPERVVDGGSPLPDDDVAPLPDDDGWPVPDELDLILETDALLSMMAARRFERIAAFRRNALRDEVPFRGATLDIAERSLRLELAAAMRITEHAAERLLSMSEALTAEYPNLLDALHGGRVTVRHADVFVDLIGALEPHLRGAIVDRALTLAETLPVGAFRRELRARIDLLRAPTVAERHAEALADRRVVVEPADDGMAWLSALMPEVEARAVFDRATRIARTIVTAPEETRTLAQVRSDVVADLLIDGEVGARSDGSRGGAGRGDRDRPRALPPRRRPRDRAPRRGRGGRTDPHRAGSRALRRSEEWMRVLTHPETGIVLSVGRTKYKPPKPLRRLVTWRAGRCLAPGCAVPADRCQVDHQLAWEDGGETAVWNNAPLCQGHHTVKHHGGWVVRQLDGGVIEWTSPTGRRYLVEPERVTPVFVPAADTSPAPF